MIYSYHVKVQFDYGSYEGIVNATDDGSAIRELFLMYCLQRGDGAGYALVTRSDSVVTIKYDLIC